MWDPAVLLCTAPICHIYTSTCMFDCQYTQTLFTRVLLFLRKLHSLHSHRHIRSGFQRHQATPALSLYYRHKPIFWSQKTADTVRGLRNVAQVPSLPMFWQTIPARPAISICLNPTFVDQLRKNHPHPCRTKSNMHRKIGGFTASCFLKKNDNPILVFNCFCCFPNCIFFFCLFFLLVF